MHKNETPSWIQDDCVIYLLINRRRSKESGSLTFQGRVFPIVKRSCDAASDKDTNVVKQDSQQSFVMRVSSTLRFSKATTNWLSISCNRESESTGFRNSTLTTQQSGLIYVL